MGYNTALMICNDIVGELQRDPEAGRKIAAGINAAVLDEPKSISVGCSANGVTILAAHHADVAQVVVVGGNYILPVMVLPHRRFAGVVTNDLLAEMLLRQMADELGYNLSKKALRKRQDASAIEARRAETRSGSVEDESAVSEAETPAATPGNQEHA